MASSGEADTVANVPESLIIILKLPSAALRALKQRPPRSIASDNTIVVETAPTTHLLPDRLILPKSPTSNQTITEPQSDAIQPWSSPSPAKGGPPLHTYPATHSTPIQVPRLTADGQMICNHLGCNRVFSQKSLWQIHVNRHTRPFYCPRRDCTRSINGFATKHELRRHEEVHKRLNGEKINGAFLCGELGCSNATDGFTLKYELRRHYCRDHPNVPLPYHLLANTVRVLKSTTGAKRKRSPDDENPRPVTQLEQEAKDLEILRGQLEQANRMIQNLEREVDKYQERSRRCLEVIEMLAQDM